MPGKTTERTAKEGEMKVTSLYLPAGILDELKPIAKAHGKNPSRVIAELLRGYIDDNKDFVKHWKAKERLMQELRKTDLPEEVSKKLLDDIVNADTLKENWSKILKDKKKKMK